MSIQTWAESGRTDSSCCHSAEAGQTVPVEGGHVVGQRVLAVGSGAVVVIHSFRENPPGLLLIIGDTHPLSRHGCSRQSDASPQARLEISRAPAIINLLEAPSSLRGSAGFQLHGLRNVIVTAAALDQMGLHILSLDCETVNFESIAVGLINRGLQFP